MSSNEHLVEILINLSAKTPNVDRYIGYATYYKMNCSVLKDTIIYLPKFSLRKNTPLFSCHTTLTYTII